MHTATLLSLGSLLAGAVAHPSGCKPQAPNGRALYTTTNDANNNHVVALAIGSDGLVSLGCAVATGGAGGSCVGADGSANGPDALSSQSALALAGDNLFVVNAGSNTVSMFAVDPRDPTRLTMVGTPAAVPGDFPNTVTASARHQLVCVATTGTTAGVACAPYGAAGIGAMDALRPFALNQTTPPRGPLGTVSQVFFSTDENLLMVNVKSDPKATPPFAGFLAAFPVEARAPGGGVSVSATGVHSAPNGTAVLFGTQPFVQRAAAGGGGGGGHFGKQQDQQQDQQQQLLFVTDASFGAGVLAVDKVTGVASAVALQPIAGQAATCWTAISPATNTAFVTDVATDRLVEMSLVDASILNTIALSSTDPGLTDIRAAGRFVYALSPGNGTTPSALTVVDVVAKQQVQHLDVSSLGLTKSAAGLEVLY